MTFTLACTLAFAAILLTVGSFSAGRNSGRAACAAAALSANAAAAAL